MTRTVAAWRTTYTPGRWLALAGPETLVIMAPPPAHTAASVLALWHSVAEAGSLDALLRLVAEAGLDTVADLAAFHWGDDGLRAIARGRVQVVDSDTSDVVLGGEGSLTWREERLGRERNLGITLEPFDPEEALRLPLVVGAASISALFITTNPASLVRFPSAEAAGLGRNASHAEPEFAHSPAPGEDDLFDAFNDEISSDDEVSIYDEVSVYEEGAGAVEYLGGGDDSPPLTATSPDEAPLAQFDDDLSLEAPPSHEFQADGLAAAAPIPVPPPVPAPMAAPAPVAAPAPPAGAADDEESGELPDPQVLAVPCTNGHANAPGSRACRICQQPVDESNARLIRRPLLAGVHTNRGDFADVVSGVIVGRAPDPGRGPAGSYLMRVMSPGNDISRSHLLVTARDWAVFVTDLNSTNGTTVLPDGEAPFTLRDGATVEVAIGTVLDLGDGVSLRIEPPRS